MRCVDQRGSLVAIQVRVRKKPDRDTLQLWYVCPLTRKHITKSAKTDNWKAAERRASEWETELAGQAMVENPPWTEFRTRFEDEVLANKPKNTRISYTSAMNNWETYMGQVQALSLITPSVVSKFAAALGKVVEQTTVASNLRHIRAVLRWAESMELIRRAPRIVLPKIGKRRLARSRAITHEEYKLLREAVLEIRPSGEVAAWQRLIDLLWFSGLRIGESLELSWDQPPLRVDLDSSKFPRLVIFSEGQKSGNDELCVMAPDFADWLRKTPVTQRKGKVVAGLEKFSRSAASHVIADCGEFAKIVTAPNKFASAHDIRRAFGTRWAKKVKPLTLQKMMRHATLQTTMSFYVDMNDEDVGSDLWGLDSVPTVVPKSKTSSRDAKNGRRKSAEKSH